METSGILKQTTLNFSVKGNNYSIKVPTMGNLIDIESSKQELSKGQYQQMIMTDIKSQWNAIELIEAIANLRVLCPELLKDLKVRDISEIDAIDSKELVKAYKEQFVPWYNEWYKVYSAE
jgi:hypothetical protein